MLNLDFTQANSYSVFSQNEWITWNQNIWGLAPARRRYLDSKNRIEINAVLYLTRSGAIRMPPLHFYLPLDVTVHDASLTPQQTDNAWLDALGKLAKEVAKRGIIGSIALPPTILDVRPFTWSGLNTSPRYTYTTQLPQPIEPSPQVRKSVRRAQRDGLIVQRTTDAAEVAHCLEGTSQRKGFDYQLTPESIASAHTALGPDTFQMHVVRSSQGEPVSAGIRLVSPAGSALGWVQGTKGSALRSGAAQLIQSAAIESAMDVGASFYDYGGANIESVAKAKSSWNFALTPFISIKSNDARALYKSVQGYAKYSTAKLRRALDSFS